MRTTEDTRKRTLVLGDRVRLETALAAWIAAVKRDDPLREVVVATGSNLAGGHLSRVVARQLGAHAAVRFVSIQALARTLAAESLERGGLRPLSPLLRERLVAALVARRAAEPWYFAPVARTPGLSRALLRTIDDLRHAGVPVNALAALTSRKAADLRALYGDYVAALQRRRLVDDAGLYDLAAQAVARGASPVGADVAVALFGIYDLPAMQTVLVRALAADRPFAAFLPWADGVRPYAGPARTFFEELGLEPYEVGEPEGRHAPGAGPPPAAQVGAQLSLEIVPPSLNDSQPAPAAGCAARGAGAGCEVRIVSVADDVAQRRAVIATLLDAAAGGVAFHEMAVVAADRSSRDRLAGAVRAQAIAVAARTAADDVAARTCRLLLDCVVPAAGRPLRRDAVIDLAATAPRLSLAVDAAGLALWDDLSRRARIVADDEWFDRLGRLEHSLGRRCIAEAAAQDRPKVDDGALAVAPAVACAGAADEAAAAASLREFAGRLRGLRRRLTGARTWRQATRLFLEAARDLCGVPPDEPVLAALAELADVELVDDSGPRGAFAQVARRALSLLETPSAARVGRDGVAVLSPQQVRGLSFRLVVFCDLAEGGFPPRPTPDPVLLDGERRAVAAACGARLPDSAELPAEHDALFALARGAATERLELLYPRLDSSTGRPRLPSRALLGVARELSGGPVRFEQLDADGELGGVVRRVGAGLGEPVDLRDFDLATLKGATAPRIRRPAWLAAYAVAVLGAGRTERGALVAASARHAALGPYDGILSGTNAARAATALFATPLSPSALQSYLSCPFAFYLRYVLGLQVPDDPDETLSIEPVDLGSLAHEILQGAYAAAVEAADVCAERVLAELEQVANVAFARAEARGLTGFPLSWRVLSNELLADLRHVVATDPCWTAGPPPARFEWSFGGLTGAGAPAAGALPPAAAASPDRPATPTDRPPASPELLVAGRLVRFRGRIDRIDASPDGRRVRLVDYKTGRGAAEVERVRDGHDVQLPVYVLALLAAGERVPDSLVAEYRMVRRSSGFRSVPLDAATDDVRDTLTATLAVAVSGIEAGVFPRWPQRACDYCDAAASCGADAIAFSRRRSDPRLRELLDFKEPVAAGPQDDS
jgi:ATP-dependent helicase/nuclease subunit B